MTQPLALCCIATALIALPISLFLSTMMAFGQAQYVGEMPVKSQFTAQRACLVASGIYGGCLLVSSCAYWRAQSKEDAEAETEKSL